MEHRYHKYVHFLDVDRFEEAIGFDPIRQIENKHGEAEDVGHCPDPWGLHKHGDTTGKFAINRDKRVFNCWVCGGGTLLSLWRGLHGVSDQEAQEQLQEYADDSTITDEDFLSEIDRILWEEQSAEPVMPYFNERVLDRMRDLDPIEDWLAGRGISLEVAHEYGLAYQADAKRMAPIKEGKDRQEPYVGPSVYLPHYWGGQLVGWQQRWLEDDRPKWVAKYTNTAGFPRENTIYNYERLYLEEREVIVCESVPTVLMLATLSYPAVCTFGSEVTEEQMRLLRRFTQGVVLAPDNDNPGKKWLGHTQTELKHRRNQSRTVLAHYLSQYIPVRVMEPVGEEGSGNDLGDLIDGGTDFAREAVGLLYREAEYYYDSHIA